MYNAVTAIRAHYNKKIKPVKAQRQWLNLTQPDSLIAFKYSSLSDTGGWHAAGLTGAFPILLSPKCVLSTHVPNNSVASDSLWLRGLQPARLLWPWNFFHQEYLRRLPFFLQGIFLTQGSNPHFLHWQMDSLPLSHQGSSFPPKTQSLYDIKNLFSFFILFRIIHMY